jgi:hypothetical protein
VMNIDAKESANTANPIAVITRAVACCGVLVWSSVTMDVRGRRAGEGSYPKSSAIRLELYSTARV